MAWTASNSHNVEMDPYVIDEVTLSGLTQDAIETVVPASALIETGTAMTPFYVDFQITTPPNAHTAVSMSKESASSTTGAVGLRFFGGDLTGAVVKVLFWYRSMKSGGIS